MTNSTKTIGLIMTLVLWSGIAAGQGPMLSGVGDDLPPDMQLPTPPGYEDSTATSLPASPDDGGFDTSGSLSDGSEFDVNCDTGYPDAGGLWNHFAPIESTGTWLQRGFWYAEADAVIYNRLWSRDSIRYAAEDIDVETPPTPNVSLGFNPLFLDTNRILIINGAQPGEDASVRTTLGHFLFRDSRNRDHTAEFTAFGGGDWAQHRVITSQTQFGLFVPFVIDGGNISFDGSSRQTIDYDSFYKSFEANYRVRQRLRRDQLVMDANGGWHRAANSGFEREYLAGLRFLELGEKFDWRAEDIAAVNSNGQYLIRTNNDLFGMQLGGGLTYQAPRWSVGVFTKGGVFINDATGNTFLDFTADDDNDSNLRLKNDELSFVGEFKIQSRFHITPNTSLRAGYEMMLMTSMALAPPQATFIPVFSYLNTTGDPFYHGASFGFEGYW